MDISVTAAAAATTEVSISSVGGRVNDNGGLRGGFAARSPLLVAGEDPPLPPLFRVLRRLPEPSLAVEEIGCCCLVCEDLSEGKMAPTRPHSLAGRK